MKYVVRALDVYFPAYLCSADGEDRWSGIEDAYAFPTVESATGAATKAASGSRFEVLDEATALLTHGRAVEDGEKGATWLV